MPSNLTVFMENVPDWGQGLNGYLELSVTNLNFVGNEEMDEVNKCDFWDRFDEYGQH